MKLLFGGLIALILLGLYVYLIGLGVLVVVCVSSQGCAKWTLANFTPEMASALALVGGLVSALVIAELAITKPGETPVARALGPNAFPNSQSTVKIITVAYLLVWLAAGLIAFVIGYLQHPRVLQPLTDLGQSWFGLAVAAGYAYFGIRPE
jgi:hypothetical protein